MPVLNLHNFNTLFILVYAVEHWGFNFETTGIPILMVNCDAKERFQNHTRL